MEENVNSKPRDFRRPSPERESTAQELQFNSSNGENGSVSAIKAENDLKSDGFGEKSDFRVYSIAGSSPARYKSMSPASLSIKRSPYLTIPPGLSPTTLLDSPVLLSNMKAEPSPTTGTFNVPLIMHDIVGSEMFSSPKATSNNFKRDDSSSGGDFEFKPHNKLCLNSGVSSLRPLQQCRPFTQVQGQYQSQTSTSSGKNGNMAVSSNELTLSVAASNLPIYMVTSRACDESQQRQGSDSGTQALQSDHKGSNPSMVVDRSSEDGYNWRKYGQKLVKGSEFPRSYYKCTHPNCQMKKQFERSHDGQITEIIYKGRHDHPKPQPSRRLAVGTILSNQGEERSDGLSLIRADDQSTTNAHVQTSHMEPNITPELSPVSASDDDIEGAASRSNMVGDEADDDDDPESKRRKKDISSVDVTPTGKVNREPRVVVQTLSEVDILDDGYRWRKYGQKVVKGNPNPRSYYKCTNAGCPVRKHVERASHDPKAVITTYEGKHNHDVPSLRINNHDTPTTSYDVNAPNRSEESSTISLDLGVGITPSPENRSNEKQPKLEPEQVQSQAYISGSSPSLLIRSSPVPVYFGGGATHYVSRQDQGESFSFEALPVNHSTNPYRQNTGRLLMGP